MGARGYIEPCLGAGAVLLALLDPSVVPAHGYMGGKRKLARSILHHGFGLRPGDGACEVVIAEAGPLGWVWSELLCVERAAAAAEVLEDWDRRLITDLWDELAVTPPFSSAAARAAQVLLLQGRTTTNCPLIWSDVRGRWEMGDRPRRPPKPAIQRHRSEEKGALLRDSGGLLSTLSLAVRVRAIARALSRQPVRFVHGDYADAIPAGNLSGWDIYWDPPYQGATSYAVDLPRARVLRDAQDFRARGATVAISEAVALDLRRWRHLDLTRPGGKPEWLTCSRWPRAVQVGLPLGELREAS